MRFYVVRAKAKIALSVNIALWSVQIERSRIGNYSLKITVSMDRNLARNEQITL